MIIEGILYITGLILLSMSFYYAIKAHRAHRTEKHPGIAWNPKNWFISKSRVRRWYDEKGYRMARLSGLCAGLAGLCLLAAVLFFRTGK